MVGDKIWIGRFEGKQMPSTNLDAIVYEDFNELRSVRVLEDQRIEVFMSELSQHFFTKTMSYVNTQGKLYTSNGYSYIQNRFKYEYLT
ncbi:hypothetical protein HW132_35965 [Brasilonema sp. CT11]|nr:hypothetical protein [Brasilonema sp. CT11]